MPDEIRERLARALARIEQAAVRAGRKPEEITLICVSKTFDPATIQKAVDAGAKELGENRVQEAASKVDQITDTRTEGGPLRWHLIGHLQSNKARQAVKIFDVIHTVDTAELAGRIDRIAGQEGRRPVVLAQIDLGGEPTKTGADERELPRLVEAMDAASNLDFRGLMTIPPFFESAEEVRPYFRRLKELLESLNATRPPGRRLVELSMGMSHDFEIAIEEGATMVRVGTLIFGERTKSKVG